MNKTGAGFNKNKFSLQKMEQAYLTNLEQLVKLLSEIVGMLCSEDTVHNHQISHLNQLHSELKYQQKMKNENDEYQRNINRVVEEAVNALKAKNEEFPKIKQMKSQHHGQLATIAEKYSEENLLSNYLRKNSHNRSNKYRNLSELERHSETLHIGGEVNREETRRSLDNPHHQDRKPLYSDLQKMKTKESIPPHKGHHEGRKYIIKSKLPNYTISKLI